VAHRKTKSVGEILRRKSAPQDDNKDGRPKGRRYEDAGLKPFRLPQGKPALRKAPGKLTNEKRERALGYQIGPTLKNALRGSGQAWWCIRKTKSVGEILRCAQRM